MIRYALFAIVLVGLSALVFTGFAQAGEWIPAVLAGALAPLGVAREWLAGNRKGGESRRAGDRLAVWFTVAMLGTVTALGLGGL